MEVSKKVVEYNLKLTEKEYYTLLVLLGSTSYRDFKEAINTRCISRIGREKPEHFEVMELAEYSEFYSKLDDNK